MSTTKDYSELVSDVIQHITEVIYLTTPSTADKHLPSWKKYHGEEMELGAKNTRVFDVLESGEGPELQFEHNQRSIYDVIINIEIAYSDDRHCNMVAMSDANQIKWELQNAVNTELNNAGFDFFRYGRPVIGEPDEDTEFRFLTFPVIARINVDAAITLELIQDTIDATDVWQDTAWSEDVIQDYA